MCCTDCCEDRLSIEKTHADAVKYSDNIMLTPDGHGKLLDFGLAKLLDPSVGEGERITDQALVETVAQTQLGVVMGTIA